MLIHKRQYATNPKYMQLYQLKLEQTQLDIYQNTVRNRQTNISDQAYKSLDLLQVDLQGDAREKNERERASASDEVASAREVDLSNLQDFHLHFAPKLSNKFSY